MSEKKWKDTYMYLKCVLAINFHAEIMWNIAVFRNTSRKYCKSDG